MQLCRYIFSWSSVGNSQFGLIFLIDNDNHCWTQAKVDKVKGKFLKVVLLFLSCLFSSCSVHLVAVNLWFWRSWETFFFSFLMFLWKDGSLRLSALSNVFLLASARCFDILLAFKKPTLKGSFWDDPLIF